MERRRVMTGREREAEREGRGIIGVRVKRLSID